MSSVPVSQATFGFNGFNESDLAKLNSMMAEVTKNLLPRQTAMFHRKIHLEVLKRVVMRTPVDTGRARGGWQSSVGHVGTGESSYEGRENASDPKAPRRAVGGPAAAHAVNQGVGASAAIQGYTMSYITNNVHYVKYLENGTSQQAPKGMVGVTLIEIGLWLKTNLARLGKK